MKQTRDARIQHTTGVVQGSVIQHTTELVLTVEQYMMDMVLSGKS